MNTANIQRFTVKHHVFFIKNYFLTSIKSYIFAFQKIKVNHLITIDMTKADIVNEISKSTGIDKQTVLTSVEAFMETVKMRMYI